MDSSSNKKLRSGIAAGLSAAAASAMTGEAHAALPPKVAGETRVVLILGDYWHSSVWQEIQIRSIYEKNKDWKVLSARFNRFVTPELINDADLLIVSRSSAKERMDWTTEGVVESVQGGGILWTDENVKAVLDGVRNRGMGLMALHCASYARNREIFDLVDVEPVMHNQMQPLWVHDANQEHPITRGIGKFFISLDEQFAAIIKSAYTTSLFQTTAIHDKRQAVGGWCRESGKGRIVGLLPGHTQVPYGVPEYREILWRSAYWAMKRDIPPYGG